MNVALSQCGARVLCENTPTAAPKTSLFFLNFIFELLTRGELRQHVTAFGAKTKTHYDLLFFFFVVFFSLALCIRQAFIRRVHFN